MKSKKIKENISKIVAGSVMGVSLASTSVYAKQVFYESIKNIKESSIKDLNKINSKLIKQFINIRESKLGRFDSRKFLDFNKKN